MSLVRCQLNIESRMVRRGAADCRPIHCTHRNRRGQTIKFTGVVSRGGVGSAGGLDWCIASYLPVCK